MGQKEFGPIKEVAVSTRVFFTRKCRAVLARRPKKVSVITRWPYYRGGRKAGFHCSNHRDCWKHLKYFELYIWWFFLLSFSLEAKNPRRKAREKFIYTSKVNVWLLYYNQSIKSSQSSNNFQNVSKLLEYHKGVHQSKTLGEVSKEA